jgi:hypothetical protein
MEYDNLNHLLFFMLFLLYPIFRFEVGLIGPSVAIPWRQGRNLPIEIV